MQPAITLQALRRLGGAVPFRSSRPSSKWGYPFWLPGLTFHRSRPPSASAEFRALVLQRKPLYSGHAFSNGIQFLRRYSAPCLPLLRATPAGAAPVFSLFGRWPFHSKRHQLSFRKRCAASVALRFLAVRARRQAGVSRFGFWV